LRESVRASHEVDWTSEPCMPTRSTGYRVTHGGVPQSVSVSGHHFPRTDRPPILANRVHSLVPFLLFGVASPALPATPFRATCPAGVPSLFAALLQGVHSVRELSNSRYIPSSGFLNLSTVCSTLHRRGLITSHSHVQGSPFRGFSRSTAVLIHHQVVPPCRFRPRTHRLTSYRTRAARLRGLDP